MTDKIYLKFIHRGLNIGENLNIDSAITSEILHRFAKCADPIQEAQR